MFFSVNGYLFGQKKIIKPVMAFQQNLGIEELNLPSILEVVEYLSSIGREYVFFV